MMQVRQQCPRCLQMCDGEGRITHEIACPSQVVFRQRGIQFFVFSQDYYAKADLVHRAQREHRQIFLIVLDDAQKFLATLSPEWLPPTQLHPNTGIPLNVWVGAEVKAKTYRTTDEIDKLVDVRARVRFLISSNNLDERRLAKYFESWRCTNCGRRGPPPMPKRCPHANALCGDAKLEPQIHWLIKRRPVSVVLERTLHQRGAVIWPEVPQVLGLTTAEAV